MPYLLPAAKKFQLFKTNTMKNSSWIKPYKTKS